MQRVCFFQPLLISRQLVSSIVSTKFKRTERQDLTFSAATAWPWSFESGKKSERSKGGLD